MLEKQSKFMKLLKGIEGAKNLAQTILKEKDVHQENFEALFTCKICYNHYDSE